MWSLLLQSLALLLAAYFVGVWVGCMARRLIAPPKGRVTETAVTPATQQQAAQKVAPAEARPAIETSPAPVAATPATNLQSTAPAASAEAPDPALAAAAAASAAVAAAITAKPDTPQPSAPAPASPAPSVAQQMQTIGTDADPVAARSHIKPEPFPDGHLPAAAGGGGETAASVAADVAKPANSEPPRPVPQDLTAIHGIDAATAVVLEREGVIRYEQLSAWNEGDVARINRALGGMRRVQEENWIEQAKILATGGLTTYARRRKAHAAAGAPAVTQLVKPSADQGNAVMLSAPAAASAAPAAAAAPPAGVEAAALPSTTGASVAADVHGDDLTVIEGITPEIAGLLKEQGVSRYAQLARLDDETANRLNGLLGIKNRIQHERWSEQAADMVGLNGAQVLASEGAAVVSLAKSPTPTASDNLRRIRGIGELIEDKLKNMGFVSYAAIADWTEADVRNVSQALEFRGRIERENWIEQARILASGGQTEFSRRFDIGE